MSIRSLRPDEPVPAGQPARYYNDHGYVRLRWRVARGEYVEEYEHRIVMGRPPGHVHHRNGVKDDNRPENLIALSGEEHRRLHGSMITGLYGKYRSRSAMEKAQRADAKREWRRARGEKMKALYESGFSSVQVAQQFDVDVATAGAILRAAGATMRPKGTDFYRPAVDYDAIRSMHAQGIRASVMCQRLGLGRKRLYQAFDHLGLPRFTSGNPKVMQARGAT